MENEPAHNKSRVSRGGVRWYDRMNRSHHTFVSSGSDTSCELIGSRSQRRASNQIRRGGIDTVMRWDISSVVTRISLPATRGKKRAFSTVNSLIKCGSVVQSNGFTHNIQIPTSNTSNTDTQACIQ